MKISKHVHSCLLVEDEGKTILIDPGNYTFEERGLDVDRLEKLDFLLITHEHPDHMHLPLIKEIVEKFPEVKIISNNSVKKILEKEGLSLLVEHSMFNILAAPHELLLGGRGAENTLFNISQKLTHPGDSLKFDKTCEILALPIQAPWGSFVASVEKAAALKPKVVIPIHDWHWKDSARRRMYDIASQYLAEKGIEFRGLEVGEEMLF
ncbi:MAG: MBL fold metallo-hydrolase [Patescibacteria group bacterium]